MPRKPKPLDAAIGRMAEIYPGFGKDQIRNTIEHVRGVMNSYRGNLNAEKKPPIRIRNTDIIQYRLPYSAHPTLIGYGEGAKRRYTMIDPGAGLYYEDFRDQLIADGVNPEQIERILVSHADPDHFSCAAYFQREYGTKVYAHEDWKTTVEDRQPDNPTSKPLGVIARHVFAYKEPKVTTYGGLTGEIEIGEGKRKTTLDQLQSFNCGDVTLTVLHSPGHTRDNVHFVDIPNGLHISGEATKRPSTHPREGDIPQTMVKIYHPEGKINFNPYIFRTNNRAFKSDSRFNVWISGH